MQLFSFQVPRGDNRIAIDSLAEVILNNAGGYSTKDVCGYWRDDRGQVIKEPMREYQVACDAAGFAAICKALPRLYPGEQCFFTARLGDAEIIPGMSRLTVAA